MSITIDQLRDVLAETLRKDGIDPNVLDVGSNHPYSCTCETCWNWWKQMGLGDEEDAPFTQMGLDMPTYTSAMNLFIRR